MRLTIGCAFAFLLPLALTTISGCDQGPADRQAKAGDDVAVLECEEIDLVPGTEKHIKIKSGTADLAEAVKELALTAKVENSVIAVAAGKEAKPGVHQVSIRGSKNGAVVLRVNLKAAEDEPVAAAAKTTTSGSQPNPERNAYFGETHVHTSWSMDAWLMGNQITGPADAYKYFKGEPIKHPGASRSRSRLRPIGRASPTTRNTSV